MIENIALAILILIGVSFVGYHGFHWLGRRGLLGQKVQSMILLADFLDEFDKNR